MKTGLKVVVIGGGSSYTPELIEGLLSPLHDLPIGELWLVDIEQGAEKVEIIAALARRMIARAGRQVTVHATLDRRAALPGADFVCSQFRAGCLAGRIRDERIALKYGMIGQETNGLGGLTNALRTIPVTLAICRDIEELCPDAWLLNFTNPSGMVTEAVTRHSRVKTVGLCNVPVIMHKGMAEMLQTTPEQLRLQVAGLNHLIWARRALLDGRDRLPDLVEQVLAGDDRMVPQNIPPFAWPEPILRPMGMIPCAYLRYYYMAADILAQEEEEAEGEGTRGEVVKAMEARLFALYRDPALDHKPAELEKRGGRYYSEAACALMSAIHHDSGALMHVNTRNDGAINGLPDDCVVEVTSMITRAGPLPLNVAPFPEDTLSLLQQMKTFERLTIAAAISGDVGLVRRALMRNPLVTTGEVLEAAIAETIRENLADLPACWQ